MYDGVSRFAVHLETSELYIVTWFKDGTSLFYRTHFSASQPGMSWFFLCKGTSDGSHPSKFSSVLRARRDCPRCVEGNFPCQCSERVRSQRLPRIRVGGWASFVALARSYGQHTLGVELTTESTVDSFHSFKTQRRVILESKCESHTHESFLDQTCKRFLLDYLPLWPPENLLRLPPPPEPSSRPYHSNRRDEEVALALPTEAEDATVGQEKSTNPAISSMGRTSSAVQRRARKRPKNHSLWSPPPESRLRLSLQPELSSRAFPSNQGDEGTVSALAPDSEAAMVGQEPRSSAVERQALKRPKNLGPPPNGQHSDTERPFLCSICDKTFKRRAHLDDHQSAIHDRRRPFECSECKRKFVTRSNLARHAQTIHERQRKFPCDVCDFACNRRSDLARHRIVRHSNRARHSPRKAQ